jgi:site-specific recombinase XerD
MSHGYLLEREGEISGVVESRGTKASSVSARVFLNGNIARRCVASIPFVYWDTELKGFGLATRPSGVRTWFVSFRRRGKMHRKKLGRTDKINSVQARKLARSELAIVALDGLPVAPKVVPDAAMLVRDFMEIFQDEYCRHWKPSTITGCRHNFREIDTAFGLMELRAVRKQDVMLWRDSYVTRQGMFNRSIPVLSGLMKYAEQKGLRPKGSNPCRGTPRFKRELPDRFLSVGEYRRLAHTLTEAEQEWPEAVQAIRLLIYTGARCGEVTSLRWEWVQPPRLMLPNSKTGPKIILLNAQARAVLDGIDPEDRSGLVFSALRSKAKPINLTACWVRLRRRAALPDVRLHDLRHSFASIAITNGISLTHIGGLLGHALPATTARYAHLAEDVVADAAARVSGSIAKCLGMAT